MVHYIFLGVTDGNFPNYEHVLQILKIVCILANSADPDEMLHVAAFHWEIHCLPKYPFRGFQYTKG